MQNLNKIPSPPQMTRNITSVEKIPRKKNKASPDPVLFPYLAKTFASNNMCEMTNVEIDDDVDAAANAIVTFTRNCNKGPIILNHNKSNYRIIARRDIPGHNSVEHVFTWAYFRILWILRDEYVYRATHSFPIKYT